jgi:aryl-alcohol dehydrogenase-like predicted oxidoreductase
VKLPTIELPGTGIRTSCIGLGCGQIVGRLTLRESRRLIETALDLGITHFDTAPSYGMGTSEEALGEVLAGIPGITVATKVGPARGVYSARANVARKFLKPVLDRVGSLKRVARRAYAPGAGAGAASSQVRPRYDFSRDRVRRELETSLRLLRRQQVDIYLAHEPHPDDLAAGSSEVFRALQSEDLVRAWGVGISARSAPWAPSVGIWQSGWPQAAATYPTGLAYIFHGVLRHAPRSAGGTLLRPAPEILREAMAARPDVLFLVSAANPGRLRELLAAG